MTYERPPLSPSLHPLPSILNRSIATHLSTHLPTRHAPPGRFMRRMGSTIHPLARSGVTLIEQLADMRVQPKALQIAFRHILRAGNHSTARDLRTQALKRLGHIPLRAGVEERQLVAGFQAIGARKHRQRARVEDLLLARGRQQAIIQLGVFGGANETGFAGVVDVHEVRVQGEMSVAAHLHGGPGGRGGAGARREGHLGEEGAGGEGDAGETPGAEAIGRGGYDLLDVGVRHSGGGDGGVG